jgi:hypothetical protein
VIFLMVALSIIPNNPKYDNELGTCEEPILRFVIVYPFPSNIPVKGQLRYLKNTIPRFQKQIQKLNMMFALVNLILADRNSLEL